MKGLTCRSHTSGPPGGYPNSKALVMNCILPTASNHTRVGNDILQLYMLAIGNSVTYPPPARRFYTEEAPAP